MPAIFSVFRCLYLTKIDFWANFQITGKLYPHMRLTWKNRTVKPWEPSRRSFNKRDCLSSHRKNLQTERDLKMSDLFCCKDSAGRYVFNIFFVSLIGAVVILFLVLGGYLFYKRYKEAKKRRRLMYRSRANTNNTNTNSTVLSGASTSEQIAISSNFILGRPPATDVVLGVYGDEASRNARTAFYDEKGWRGFAYWKIFYFAQGWEVQSIFLRAIELLMN